ncbi:MAG TPA: glycoside hydrolase family 97 N-terminal domain-containing protein, partial [Bacteroidota bacterium]|nr:glycoside hydrolase family 97 N-terminal domain-containing protein [Bacteroidota bacterium]
MRHICLILFLLFAQASMSSAQEIISPNKNIKVVLVTKAASDTARYGQPYFSVRYKSGAKYIEVLPNSPLGIIRSDQAFSDNLRLIRASKPAAIRERYTMVSGKRAVCSNDGTERVLRYENSNHQELDLIMRVYDNGIAFSYRFPAHSDSV